MIEDDILIKHSKSSESNVPNLNDYIQFTFQAGTYSIDDFNTKIKAAFTTKAGARLKLKV